MKKHVLYKKWESDHNGGFFRLLPQDDELAYLSADLMSGCYYAWQKGRLCAVESKLISFDVDYDRSDKSFGIFDIRKKMSVLCKSRARKAIQKHYPKLGPYIHDIVPSRNDGLCILIHFPSFLLTDQKIKIIALQLQERIAKMLTAIGLGCDPSARGLERDVINPYKSHGYRNKRKKHCKRYVTRKDGNGNPIVPVLSHLLTAIAEHKAIWDESKKRNPDHYLYPDVRVEKRLAAFYLQSELEFTQKYATQKDLALAIGVDVRLIKKLSDQERCKWLRIESDGLGVNVTTLKHEKLQRRAERLIKGKTNGAFDDWNLPVPSLVMDGQRNDYIMRLAVILRDNGFAEKKAAQIIRIYCQNMPDRTSSKSYWRIPDTVRSIYRNFPAFPVYHALELIPQIQETLDQLNSIKKGNVPGGDLGGRDWNKKEEKKKPESQTLNHDRKSHLHLVKNAGIFDLKSVPYHYEARTDKNGRERMVDHLKDHEQKNLQKFINEDYLSPLLSSFLHSNSFAYRKGKSVKDRDLEAERLYEIHGHFIKFDISKYFESINQSLLMTRLSAITGEAKAEKIMAAVTADRIIEGELTQRKLGIATGSSLSPSLSNLYLTDFDFWLQSRGVSFVRFADDIMIFGRSPQALFSFFKECEKFLESMGLKINQKKSRYSWVIETEN